MNIGNKEQSKAVPGTLNIQFCIDLLRTNTNASLSLGITRIKSNKLYA